MPLTFRPRLVPYGHHEDRTPTHGYEATPEAAMAAFRANLSFQDKLAVSAKDELLGQGLGDGGPEGPHRGKSR
jgi:hypothetical protein